MEKKEKGIEDRDRGLLPRGFVEETLQEQQGPPPPQLAHGTGPVAPVADRDRLARGTKPPLPASGGSELHRMVAGGQVLQVSVPLAVDRAMGSSPGLRMEDLRTPRDPEDLATAPAGAVIEALGGVQEPESDGVPGAFVEDGTRRFDTAAPLPATAGGNTTAAIVQVGDQTAQIVRGTSRGGHVEPMTADGEIDTGSGVVAPPERRPDMGVARQASTDRTWVRNSEDDWDYGNVRDPNFQRELAGIEAMNLDGVNTGRDINLLTAIPLALREGSKAFLDMFRSKPVPGQQEVVLDTSGGTRVTPRDTGERRPYRRPSVFHRMLARIFLPSRVQIVERLRHHPEGSFAIKLCERDPKNKSSV